MATYLMRMISTAPDSGPICLGVFLDLAIITCICALVYDWSRQQFTNK